MDGHAITHLFGNPLDDSISSAPMSEVDLCLSCNNVENLLTLQPTSDTETDQASACSSSSLSRTSYEALALDDKCTVFGDSGICQVGVEDEEPWCGFKLVGDNIDKHVRPRHESIERRS